VLATNRWGHSLAEMKSSFVLQQLNRVSRTMRWSAALLKDEIGIHSVLDNGCRSPP